MKIKIFTILLLCAGKVMALGADFSISAGMGGILGGFITRYTITAKGEVEDAPIKIKATQDMEQFDYGFFAFIDSTYGILSVSYQDGENNYKEIADVSALGSNVNQSGKGWESVVGIGLLGKYPFNLNEKFNIFPLLGVKYQISLSQRRTQPDGFIYNRDDGLREKDKDGKAFGLKDWNSLWINLGCGLDYNLTDDLFIRCELIYGFRWLTSYESKNVDLIKSQANDPSPGLFGLTSGPSVRFSAGYKFLSR